MGKFTDFLTGGSNDKNEIKEGEEQYYEVTKEEYHEQNGIAGSRMMLLEPRAYSESQQIADYLKKRSAVVVNLKRVTPDQAKRIIDFLYGTIYAIGGRLEKLGGGIFLATPNNFNLEGTITNEKDEKGHSKKGENEKEEDDFF